MPEPITLDNGHLVVNVSRQGGAVLDACTRDGRAFLRPHADGPVPFDVTLAGCFPLVPVGNRVEGNGFDFAGKHHVFEPNTDEKFYIHGDGWLGAWDVASLTQGDCPQVTLSFNQTKPDRSPHIYHAIQTIGLAGSRLTLELCVKNSGPEALPFGIGFHPFFPRTGQVRVQARAGSWWSEGPNHLPGRQEPIPADADFSEARMLPDRWLNNCYEGWNGEARIEWPEASLAAVLTASGVFSKFMLYAPTDLSFFCLEPMSHTPNAMARSEPLGLRVLHPGERLSGSMAITVSELGAENG